MISKQIKVKHQDPESQSNLGNSYCCMTQYLGSCGVIKNFFTPEELGAAVTIFKKVNTSKDTSWTANNGFYGIDQKHLAYLWLRKTLVDRIFAQFDPSLKLIFGMLLDCHVPLEIHHDLKPIPDPNGKHSLSFLIPYSVDHEINKCPAASTLIFDQSPDGDNNVSYLHATKLGHVPLEQTYQYSLKQDIVWNCGDLVWWDSSLYHAGSNFLANGCHSKQGIVIHTYVV